MILFHEMLSFRLLKEPVPFFFPKSLQFWYHKNCHIFLIIILKFYALIPSRLEENLKNSSILLNGQYHR